MLLRQIITLSLFASATAFANVNYQLDAAHSTVGFKIKHLGISNTKGQFKKYSGVGTYDEKTGQLSDIKVAIEVESIDTENTDRDKHLRSADFFDADKFKEITFASTKVVSKGKRPTEIHGKLTMKGVTKDVVLRVTEWGGTATDPWGNEKAAFSATGKIDRRDFGITWNKPLDKLKGLTVGNDVELVLEIEANKEVAKK